MPAGLHTPPCSAGMEIQPGAVGRKRELGLSKRESLRAARPIASAGIKAPAIGGKPGDGA